MSYLFSLISYETRIWKRRIFFQYKPACSRNEIPAASSTFKILQLYYEPALEIEFVCFASFRFLKLHFLDIEIFF